MEKFKTLHVSEVFVPARLRMVDDDHALAIQASITQHGQFNPVTVRVTPNGERPYTLVAGAHRYRAIELMDEEGRQIDVMIVKADKDEAVLLEIEEILFRNDLSVLDRAVFVETYRDQWEKTHGKINPKGGRPKTGHSVTSFEESPVGLVEGEAKRGFSKACADRLGISVTSVKYLGQIAKLPKPVREAIAQTPCADNRSQLLKLAKLPPEKLKKFPRALKETSDFAKSLEALDPPAPKPDPALQQLSALIGAWSRATPEARAKFLDHANLIEGPSGGGAA